MFLVYVSSSSHLCRGQQHLSIGIKYDLGENGCKPGGLRMGFVVAALLAPSTQGDDVRRRNLWLWLCLGASSAYEQNCILSTIFSFKIVILICKKLSCFFLHPTPSPPHLLPYFRVILWEEVSKGTRVLPFGDGKNGLFLEKSCCGVLGCGWFVCLFCFCLFWLVLGGTFGFFFLFVC